MAAEFIGAIADNFGFCMAAVFNDVLSRGSSMR
jgi:hypothetical protein